MNTAPIRSLLRAAGILFARSLSPDACAACDALAPRAVFCRACAETVTRADGSAVGSPRTSDSPIQLLAFAEFEGAVAEAIRRLKYGSRPDLARPLGELLRHAAREAALGGEVVVPVPLHPRRLAERGYNQAALLARPLAFELEARFAPRALARRRDTPKQATLERRARLENVAHAFEARTPAELARRHVILVDDVATTGATLEACRVALAGAGAASVTAVVLARRAPPR